jgi:large repetitive protein
LNLVDNYFKPGPSTVQRPELFHDGVEAVAPASLFLSGNVLEGDEKVTADNWRGTGFYFDQKKIAASTPFPAPPVATEDATESFHNVLAHAGATLPMRDAVDDRIVREVTDGSGHIIESVSDVGQP